MKVTVCGAGKVGTFIAYDLLAAGHEVLMIEKDPDRAARASERLQARWFVADACELSSLHESGLQETEVVVAATGEDQVNLVISLLSKQEFAVPRVVARVNHPKNHWLFNETWGVDVAVSTPHLLTALVEEAVSVGSLVQLLQFDGGDASLVEVTLAPASPAAGKAIAELDVPRDASIVAMVRQRKLLVPRDDTVLQVGDEVLALVTKESEEAVRQLLIGAAPVALSASEPPAQPRIS